MADAASVTPLALTGSLTMRQADELRATLGEAIARHDLVAVDCAAASDIDLVFIQLLLAARVSARGSQRRLALAGPPQGALLETLARAGFVPRAEPVEAAEALFWFESAGR